MNRVVDYAAMLYQWRADNIPNADRIKNDEYYNDITNKNILVVTAGDSWTYGDTLGETRLLDVYGRKVSGALNADWINIGLSGRANSYILKNLSWLIPQLEYSQYKKIFVIVTLTENGREPGDFFATSIDYTKIYTALLETPEFYDAMLVEAEHEWITELNQIAATMPSNCNLIVGQNFAWHQSVVENLSANIIVLQSNWIEKLAEFQNMELPPRGRLVTSWIFDTVRSIHNMFPQKNSAVFKTWAIPYIEQANKINRWLAGSKLNAVGASKHPAAQGHSVWADYILGHLNVD